MLRVHRVDPLTPTDWRNQLAWEAVTGILRTGLRSLFRVSTADTASIPDGPLIIAPNHRSFLDPMVVGSLIDRRVVFMMHGKYYDVPFFNSIYRMARCICVEEEDNKKALRDAKAVLEAGRALCIFPEGTISPDGELQPAQPGMAWLAHKTGAPVLPMHVGGTREALTKGSWRVRLHPITLRTGELLYPDRFPRGREGHALLTDAVMTAIADLGRQALRR